MFLNFILLWKLPAQEKWSNKLASSSQNFLHSHTNHRREWLTHSLWTASLERYFLVAQTLMFLLNTCEWVIFCNCLAQCLSRGMLCTGQFQHPLCSLIACGCCFAYMNCTSTGVGWQDRLIWPLCCHQLLHNVQAEDNPTLYCLSLQLPLFI